MNKQRMIATLKQEFMRKRLHAQEECEEFISSLRQNQDFNKLYTDYSLKNLQRLKAETEKEQLELKNDIIDLQTKINTYLKSNNIDRAKLSPNYDCKICNDTGVAGGRMCTCLSAALSKKITQTASSYINFKDFEQVDTAIMDEMDIKACDFLKKWCAQYPNISKININLTGVSGCGKSFMLECVASELVKQGVAVYFKTAFELNELARLYHIGKSYDFSDCINADVLIIDDLGTEPVLKNVTKEYLYNLINTRQINNLPTLISTNLSFDDILSRYDERIFSRLANKKLSINISLTSKDKRIK